MFRVFVASFFLLSAHLWAAPATPNAIDQIVLAQMKIQHSPGVAIAIVRNGKVLKVQGYGKSNVELHTPVNAETFFQTGSMGKQFTAVLVMLLVRDGTLKLDASVSSYLSGTPPTWKAITVRRLLTHTSGLAYSDSVIDLRKDYTEAQRLASAYRVPLLSAPG